MAPVARRSLMLGLAALACGAMPLRAQCPDGTPPPCRAAAPAPARGPVDENLIAIFPFRITGTSSDAASLREGAMDLLGLALDEQAGLRVVSSRTLLARARGFTDATSVNEAAAIARSLGAGTMVLGNAVVVGAQVRARAELHDVIRNRPITSIEARGTASDPAPVIDSLAAGLARVRLAAAAGSRRSVQEFASTSPQALRAYLAGERLGRQGRWQEAGDSLSAAVQLDSTFGLAYYRLSVVSRYSLGAVSPVRNPILAALRFQSRLPRRQLELLRSVYAAQRGVLQEALAQVDATAAAYPDDPEVAFEQGEAYFHTGMALGGPTEPAERAFARTIGLDSAMIEPYNHLIELLVIDGDTATAWRLAERAHALAPSAEVQLASWFMLRILRGESPEQIGREALAVAGPAGIQRTITEIVRIMNGDPAHALATAGALLSTIGPGAPLAAQELARSSHAMYLAARGQFVAARREATGTEAALVLDALTGRASREPAGWPLSDSTRTAALALMGWHAVLSGDSAGWTAAARRLERVAPPFDAYGHALATGLEGLAALQRGDSTRARTLLIRVAEVRPFSGVVELSLYCVLKLAQLERAAGTLEPAMRHARALNWFNGLTLERAEAELLTGQIAEQLGDSTTAIRAYRNFIGLWQDADPELQPRVTAARAALATLEHR